MAGKHRRKPSRRRSAVRRRSAPSLMAAALGATSLTTALTTGTTVTMSPAVELTALITPASSTAQIFASSDYYNRDWISQYGQPQVVPFFLGPQGIVNAIDQNAGDPRGVVVLASGWGAGQTSTALAIMQANDDPAMDSLTLVVLDNNTNRAGGGFWTTYWMFAPLLLTSAEPTPSDTNAPILDVAYEYNINSDAPTYPINLLADANSLVAYVYGYGQSTAPVPDKALNEAKNAGPNTQHYHYVVAPDGKVVDKIPVDGDITYVTFQSDGLPLVRPLRMIPGGDVVADAVEPTLTTLVNWGYQDNEPIPDDPGETRPVGLLPPLSQTTATIQQLPGAVQQGAQAGVAAAQQDLTSPGNLVTGPLSEITTTASVVTNNSPAPMASLPTPTRLSSSTIDMKTGSKFFPGGTNTTGSSSSGSSKPVRQVVGSVSSALGSLADGLTSGVQKNATSTTPGS